MYSYISPLIEISVHLYKPAHYREVAFIEKTGGCNNKVSVWERTLAQAPGSSDTG